MASHCLVHLASSCVCQVTSELEIQYRGLQVHCFFATALSLPFKLSLIFQHKMKSGALERALNKHCSFHLYSHAVWLQKMWLSFFGIKVIVTHLETMSLHPCPWLSFLSFTFSVWQRQINWTIATYFQIFLSSPLASDYGLIISSWLINLCV